MLFAGITRLLRQPERLHFGWTTRRQLTTKTDIALLQDIVPLESTHRLHIAVVDGIGVPADGPAVAVTVKEDDNSREVVVMVDNELEVREGLAAFVLGGMNRRVDIVDGINEIAPSGKIITSD